MTTSPPGPQQLPSSGQQPAYPQQAAPLSGYPPPGYPPPGYQAAPQKKRRRVFLWIFLAVQVVFIIWLITGLVSSGNNSVAPDVAQSCANGAWHALYNSYQECSKQTTDLYNAAHGIGTTMGVGLVIGLWAFVDFVLGLSYGIYRLASRPR